MRHRKRQEEKVSKRTATGRSSRKEEEPSRKERGKGERERGKGKGERGRAGHTLVVDFLA